MGCEGANMVGDERDVEAEHSCGVAYVQFTCLAWRERDAYARGVAETESRRRSASSNHHVYRAYYKTKSRS